jgi:uncharacterized protein YecE (DUF72 family)
MKNKIRVGTCGFHVTKDKYVEMFSCVEIQHTFYQPPQIKTLTRWRAEVPADFEFAIKAWQLITHEAKSPTYKRLKKKLTEEELTQTGRFQPTAIVREAWETTLACAQALKRKRFFSNARRALSRMRKISKISKIFRLNQTRQIKFRLRAARRGLDGQNH